MAATAKPILSTLTPQQREYCLACLNDLVDRSGGPDACWPWTGGTLVGGYGCFYIPATAKTRRMVKAHRLVFELANDGLCPPTVDHRCHDNDTCAGGASCLHRRCCNPAHLKAATIGVNAARAQSGKRQETCRAGHRMDPDNTYEAPDGSHRCRACAASWMRFARETREQAQRLHRLVKYRPRGMTKQQLVDFALAGLSGDGCWFSPYAALNGSGYPGIHLDGRTVGLHRLVYEVRIGPIPPGHVVDHACHDPQMCPGGIDCPHRACVNPEHLVAVPAGVNTSAARSSRRRPERCKRKHLFTPENTYTDRRGSRHCMTCSNERQQGQRERDRAAAGPDRRLRKGGICRNGHNVAEVGVTAEGKCRECARERNREYEAREAAALRQ